MVAASAEVAAPPNVAGSASNSDLRRKFRRGSRASCSSRATVSLFMSIQVSYVVGMRARNQEETAGVRQFAFMSRAPGRSCCGSDAFTQPLHG